MAAYDDLERILAAGSWRELEAILTDSSTSEADKQVRRWFRERRTHWQAEYEFKLRGKDPDHDGASCMRLLAAGLGTPVQAAAWVRYFSWGWLVPVASDEALVRTAVARGPEWCQAFLDAASARPVRGADVRTSAWIARVGLALIRAGVAELPAGPGFPIAWAQHYSHSSAGVQWGMWIESSGRGDDPPPALYAGTLVELLRDDPVLPAAMSAVLAEPGAVAVFEEMSWPGWELAPAVAVLVGEGRLGRSRMITGCLEALTRKDSPTAQKAIAKLLTALELGCADLAGQIPLVQGLLATGSGAVTAALLPAVIGAVNGDEFTEVAATILARREKAQRTQILRAAAAPGAVARWGRQPVIAVLGLAAQLEDQAVASKAAQALAVLDADAVSAEHAPVDHLWSPLPDRGAPGVIQPLEPDERGVTEGLSGLAAGNSFPAQPAVLWDALVRWFAASPAAAAEWMTATAQDNGEASRPVLGRMLVASSHPRTLASHRQLCEEITASHMDGIRKRGATFSISSLSTTAAISEVFASETVLRLGTIPYLVSTPSLRSGELHFDALVDRLRGYGRTAVGTADLFLALLRLEPVDPARVNALDGLSLPVWTAGAPPTFRLFGRARVDAVDLVRRWVMSGGLPERTYRHEAGTVSLDPVSLPVDLTAFPGMPPELTAGHRSGVQDEYYDWAMTAETTFGIVPRWPDLLAARTQLQFDQSQRFAPRWLPLLVECPHAPGAAVHHVVASTLCHADEDHRLRAVDATLILMERRWWDADAYTRCCAHLLGSGDLRLARLASSWEQVILGGGLMALWPSVLRVLEDACARERKPAGLAELLAMVRRYVRAVPRADLPASVHALAGSKGGSKARLEAVALVVAAGGRGLS